MKNCEFFEELISLYVDEMIGEAELLELLEHLETCPECQSYYNDVKDHSSQLKNINIEIPEDLNAQICESFEQNKQVQIVQIKAPKRKYTYMSLVACACVALFVSIDFSVNKTVNVDDAVPALIQGEMQGSVMRIMDQDETEYQANAQTIPADETELPVGDLIDVETQFDDYAFVFFYRGDEICEIPNSTIIYSDETTTHIEVENSIPKIQSTMKILESNGFVENKSLTYKIDADSNKGLFIIKYGE